MTRYDRNGVAEEHWDDPRYDSTAFDEPEREPLTLEQAVQAFAYGSGLADDEVFGDTAVAVHPDKLVVTFDDGQQLTVRFELEAS